MNRGELNWAHNKSMKMTPLRSLLEREGKDPRPVGTRSEAAVNAKLFPSLIEYMVKQDVYVNPTLALQWGAAIERWRDRAALAEVLTKRPSRQCQGF